MHHLHQQTKSQTEKKMLCLGTISRISKLTLYIWPNIRSSLEKSRKATLTTCLPVQNWKKGGYSYCVNTCHSHSKHIVYIYATVTQSILCTYMPQSLKAYCVHICHSHSKHIVYIHATVTQSILCMILLIYVTTLM